MIEQAEEMTLGDVGRSDYNDVPAVNKIVDDAPIIADRIGVADWK